MCVCVCVCMYVYVSVYASVYVCVCVYKFQVFVIDVFRDRMFSLYRMCFRCVRDSIESTSV
jgi:type IV secretory pathway VirB3-like protein